MGYSCKRVLRHGSETTRTNGRDTVHAKGAEGADFSEQISQLKKVTAGQESSSQEILKKLNKRTYQFQRKGNEAQDLIQFVGGGPPGGRGEERASEVNSRGRARDGHSKKLKICLERRY